MTSITAIGLVSALGTDSSTSLAAARAGLSRAAPLKTVNPLTEDYLLGAPLIGHTLPGGLAEGFVGAAKARLMGRAALDDLLAKCGDRSWERTGVYLVLSNCFLLDATQEDGGGELDGEPEAEQPSVEWTKATEQLLPSLLDQTPVAAAGRKRLYYGGHAGIVRALEQAHQDLMANAVDACVVGAIDSCIEPRVLRAAARAQMLKTSDIPNGFMPGEGAAFFLLQREAEVTGGAPVQLTAFAAAVDPRHSLMDLPPDGTGLATAVEACVARLSAEQRARLGLVVADLNGEERRALEWGYCLVRLKSSHPLSSTRTWLPAASFGETGCASGPLAICVAVRALERGYAGSGQVAVVLSSEDGEKAALCLGR